MSTGIRLIVGLGNPGPEHAHTRHNAGAWFLEALAEHAGTTLKPEKKFHGLFGQMNWQGNSCYLLLPTTFMNLSGNAVLSAAHFYKIPPEAIVIAHDELDLPVGTARIKQGGGHGGHNGLRDIHAKLGCNDYYRIRLGIGHPGHSHLVTGYVLGKPSNSDREAIFKAIDHSIDVLPSLLTGDTQKAMRELHT